MIANIYSFERMKAAINEFQPFKAPGPDGLYPVLLPGPQRENFQGVRRSIPGSQILLGPQALSGAHAVKSFFVQWG